MKFLCIDCDTQMQFEEREEPGDGTFAAAFRCPTCGRQVALLANPMETQMVKSLGVRIGGATLDQEPLDLVRSNLASETPAPISRQEKSTRSPQWSGEAQDRLSRVPNFVRGMVKRLYQEYALDKEIAVITPEVMDQARVELGLEGM